MSLCLKVAHVTCDFVTTCESHDTLTHEGLHADRCRLHRYGYIMSVYIHCVSCNAPLEMTLCACVLSACLAQEVETGWKCQEHQEKQELPPADVRL